MPNRARQVVAIRACVLLLAYVGAGFSRPAFAAAQGDHQDQTAVVMSSGTQSAGGDVVIPLTLSAGKEIKVGSVDVRITFMKAALAFVQIELGGLADSVDAAVDSEVLAGTIAGESVLHASISTTGSGGSRLPIPSGPIAYLTFKINQAAKPQSTITPTLDARLTTTDTPSQPIAPVVTSAGDITVSSGPVFGCFFYMH